jgi:ferredoxin-NADP reductase
MHSGVAARLLYSSRRQSEVIYRQELASFAADEAVDVRFTLTREQPDGWDGYARRIDRELLAELAWPAGDQPLTYICGPTAFVETAANTLVELGQDAARIRTERFGPTG